MGDSPIIYRTYLEACPLCRATQQGSCKGNGLVFLKGLPSGRLFAYCLGCNAAWDRPPTIEDPGQAMSPSNFAPEGVAFPERKQIERMGWEKHIVAEEPDATYEFLRLTLQLNGITVVR